jgi:hypothetical protein
VGRQSMGILLQTADVESEMICSCFGFVSWCTWYTRQRPSLPEVVYQDRHRLNSVAHLQRAGSKRWL